MVIFSLFEHSKITKNRLDGDRVKRNGTRKRSYYRYVFVAIHNNNIIVEYHDNVQYCINMYTSICICLYMFVTQIVTL